MISLRRRLLAVTLLSVLACAGAGIALQGLARSGVRARVERAEDAARLGVERIALRASVGGEAPPPWRAAGLSGLLDARGARLGAPSPDRRGESPALDALRAEAFAEALRSGAVAVRSTEAAAPRGWSPRWRRPGANGAATGVGHLVVAVGPVPGGGRWAWAAGWVPVLPGRGAVRLGVGLLVAATGLLVAMSLHALARLQRGALGLRGTLDALALDLAAPVSQPDVRELAMVSEGIAEMAATLRHTEAERERLRAELVEGERLASLGRVAAGIAHEVRNPLAAIKLKIDLAAMELPPTQSATAQDLAEVGAEIARLDRLVSDLLVIAGRRVLRRELTDLAALAQARCALQGAAAEAVALRYEVTGTARAEVDRDGMTRVIDNLLRNARDASPVGGTIRVQLSEDAQGAMLRVLDEGPGVDPARLPELFEPFFTTRAEGTGLGLALSRAVVRAHGGVLRYARDEGRTVFVVELPRAASAQEA